MKHWIRGAIPAKAIFTALVLPVVFTLFLSLPGWTQETGKTEEEAEKQAQKVQITEEIIVVGKAPRKLPVATMTTITDTQISRRRERPQIQPLLPERHRPAAG